MKRIYKWISSVSGFRFISIRDKAICIQSTLESFLECDFCKLKDYQKSIIKHLVNSTDISIEDILKKIVECTSTAEYLTFGQDRELKELFIDIECISKLYDDLWFCERSSLDLLHFSKRKWQTLISQYISAEVKSYQMRPVSNVAELATLISSLQRQEAREYNSESSHMSNKLDSQRAIERDLYAFDYSKACCNQNDFDYIKLD